jgi:hypothetical protein
MRKLLSIALLVPLVAVGGCSRDGITPPVVASTPAASETAAPSATPIATPEQDAATADPPTEPLPAPVPVSTGPLNLSGGQTAARAKLIVIESHSVTTIALDGSTLGTYVLPGDLRALIEGLSFAFGRGPTIISHAPYSWVYDWGGFSVTDFSPSISSPADPPYKVSATVSGIGVTQFETANGIQVGDPASSATSIADEVLDGGGYYWATIDAFHVAVPGVADARIYIEISAPSGTGAIAEIRGPTGSWTS